jgi:hypothetical protein
VDVLAVGQVSQFAQYVVSPQSDFNGNRIVDGGDLFTWRGAFGASNLGDTDGDYDTDGADFLAWQRQLGAGPPGTVTFQAIPEPSAAALILMVGLGATLMRQRHHH